MNVVSVEKILNGSVPFDPEPPRPLHRELPPPEPFPIDALGDVLGNAAHGIQARIQAPAAICGQGVLATATLAVQAHANIRLPYGQPRPLSGYFVSVAESGERKTAEDNEALWPVRTFEERLRDAHRADTQSHANTMDAWE